jgi:AcrR family transcriptional regulator
MANKVKEAPVRKRRVGRPPADFSAHDALLLGAERAFGTLGFADAGIDDICSAANVGRATFYRFFKNKDEILEALFERANTLVEDAVVRAISSTSGVEQQIEAGVEAFLRAQFLNGKLARVLVAEVMSGRFAKQREKNIQVFVKVFQTGMRNLGIKAPDVFVIHGLIGALEAISLEMLAEGEMDERLLARAKGAMLRIIKGTLLGA